MEKEGRTECVQRPGLHGKGKTRHHVSCQKRFEAKVEVMEPLDLDMDGGNG